MPSGEVNASTVASIAGAVLPVAAAALVTPFSPLIALALTAIRAHYNATGQWPTEAQVMAAVPQDYQNLKDIWASWDKTKQGG